MENSEKNLQGKSFKGQNLPNADFSGADLRGADFTGAVLTNADFSKCKTGLKTGSVVMLLIFSLVISLLSGYIAMLTSLTVQALLKSTDQKLVISGYITTGLIFVFIILAIINGGRSTIKLILFTIAVVLLMGFIVWLTEFGSGKGALYGAFSIILLVAMVFVGAIARVTAGTLSSGIIFLIVAVAGGVFGKSLGGGIGAVILAVSCAVISKRILSGAAEFKPVKDFAYKAGAFFGTSFKNADLTGANFSEAVIKNTNFTGAKLSGVNWEKSVKKFCLEDAV